MSSLKEILQQKQARFEYLRERQKIIYDCFHFIFSEEKCIQADQIINAIKKESWDGNKKYYSILTAASDVVWLVAFLTRYTSYDGKSPFQMGKYPESTYACIWVYLNSVFSLENQNKLVETLNVLEITSSEYISNYYWVRLNYIGVILKTYNSELSESFALKEELFPAEKEEPAVNPYYEIINNEPSN